MDYWIVAPANAAAIGQRIEIQGVATTQQVPTSATADNVDPLIGALLSMHPAITYAAAAKTFTYQWREQDLAAAVRTKLDDRIDPTDLEGATALDSDSVEGTDHFLLSDRSASAGQTQLRRLSLNAYGEFIQPQINRTIGFPKVLDAANATTLTNNADPHGTVIFNITQALVYRGTTYTRGAVLVKTDIDNTGNVYRQITATDTDRLVAAQIQAWALANNASPIPSAKLTAIATWARTGNTDNVPTNKITLPNQQTPETSGLKDHSLYFLNGELYALPDNTQPGIKLAYNRDIGQQDFPTWNLRGYNRGDRIFIPGRRHTDEQRADQTATFPAYQPRTVPGPAGTSRTYHTTTATNIADPADNIEFIGPQDYRTALRNRFIISQHGRGLDRYGSLTFKIYNPDRGMSSESSYTLTPHNRVDLITPVVNAADRIPASGAVRGINFQTASEARPFIYLMDASNIDEAYDISTLASHSRFQTAYTTDNRVWANFRQSLDEEWSTTDYTTFKADDIPFGVDIKIDWRPRNTERLLRDITFSSGWFKDLTHINARGADRRVSGLTMFAEYFADTADIQYHASDANTAYHFIRINYNVGGRAQNLFDIGFAQSNGVLIFRSDHVNLFTNPTFHLKW